MQSGVLRLTTAAAPHSRIFRGMPRDPFGKAVHQRHRCEDGGVACTAGEDDVRAGLERADEGLGAHHADDVLAAVDRRLVEFRRRMRAA